ncbi:MAG: caspase family protein [Pseudobacter sp.]|uniref:caspase family protein n=1 Tax=Pseudobacter sp. TaxID=2045420 RepID=UPI003F80A519
MYKIWLVLALYIVWVPVSAQDKAELVIPEGHRMGQILDILFNHENVITIGYKQLMFWKRRSGALVKKIEGIETSSAPYISEIYNKSCNRIVVICNNSKNVKIINLENGRTISEINDSSGTFEEAILSADGKLFATAFKMPSASVTNANYRISIWDAETGKLLQEPGLLPSLSYQGKRIQFSNNCRKLLMFNHASVRIWDITSGRQSRELKTNLNGKITSAMFNSQDNKILSKVGISNIAIWDVNTGDILHEIKVPELVSEKPGVIAVAIFDAAFTPDGKKAIIYYRDTVRIWNLEAGRPAGIVHGNPFMHGAVTVSNDGKRVITACKDSTARIWDLETTKEIYNLPISSGAKNEKYASYSADGKTILTSSRETGKWTVWDAATGSKISQQQGGMSGIDFVKYSGDGNDLATAFNYNDAPQVRNKNNYALKYELKGSANSPTSLQVNAPGKNIAIGYNNGRVLVHNMETGLQELNIQAHSNSIAKLLYSPSGKQIITTSSDGTAKLWEAKTGTLLKTFIHGKKTGSYVNAVFSPDSKKILTFRYDDSVAKIWDIRNDTSICTINGFKKSSTGASFNANGKRLLTTSISEIQLWNTATGKLISSTWGPSAFFSNNGNVLISADFKKINFYNTENGQKIRELKLDIYYNFHKSELTPDGENILALKEEAPVLLNLETGKETVCFFEDQSVWDMGLSPNGNYLQNSSYHNFNLQDARTGKLLLSVPQNNVNHGATAFSKDSKTLIILSDYAVNFWDVEKKEFLYSFYSIDSTDYLCVDKDSRYDGTNNAIKLLNFNCNMELIGLDQVKEPLWEPNLVNKIVTGEEMEAKKLSDVDICGYTPLVSTAENEKEYIYTVTPRKGGLGESIVYVNNIAISSYDNSQLTRTGNTQQLRVNKDSLKQFFRDDISNNVSIKAFTSDNEIFARGDEFFFHDPVKRRGPVNMYAIIIGVSDYKGTELDLRYPAKDANDLSNALGIAARKLLNGDGKEHVFIYNLNTSNTRTQYPDKQSIRQVFEMVGNRATANDIVFVFAGGHGVLYNPKYGPVPSRKQFYFLTADASKNSDYSQTGISMTELGEWMKPHNIRAQKRILIFDACNSGQAIDDLMAGVRAKGDETGRIKALERLNERSGMFILSAAASDQNAYEMGLYSQGVLTYALLKVIREQPAILEDGRFLNVDKWFTAAEKKVIDIISKTRVRQQPQKFTTGGFNIGIVDNEVISRIVLAKEKPLFSSSIFLHGSVKHDDIKLTKEVNRALSLLQTDLNSVAFIPETESPDAYTLTGAYEINGPAINMTVNVTLNSTIRYSFPVKGTRNDIPALAMEIARKAGAWAGKK